MRQVLAIVITALVASAAWSDDGVAAEEPETVREAYDVNLNDFMWLRRPLVVFADNPADPRYQQQMGYLLDRLEELEERDVVVLTDSDPSKQSQPREKLHPRGFMLVLIGKDGSVYLRKPFPWDVREITRSIDKMPLRQQEIRDRR